VEGAAVLLGVISETSFALGLLRFLVVHIWLWEKWKKGSRTKNSQRAIVRLPHF
jgi:hypothetical protein